MNGCITSAHSKSAILRLSCNVVQERGLLQGYRRVPGRAEQGPSIPWVEITRRLRRGVRIRHDNMVKNHWNGSLSTCYHAGTLSTPFVHRQRVLMPLPDMTALLQASCLHFNFYAHSMALSSAADGSVVACYHAGTLYTPFVQRQRVLMPLADMTALLQVVQWSSQP